MLVHLKMVLMRGNQRSIEKGADERDQDGECLITWDKCGPSGAPAEPFLPSFFGMPSCLFLLFVNTRTFPFLCFCLLFINTVLTLSCSPNFFCLCFCFLSSCGSCLCSWLLQLPLLVFFVSETSNMFFVTMRFLPTSLHYISENWGHLWISLISITD